MSNGRVLKWFTRTVLKTVGCNSPVSSNLTPSADRLLFCSIHEGIVETLKIIIIFVMYPFGVVAQLSSLLRSRKRVFRH